MEELTVTIFALAGDYAANSPDTTKFFQIIQNKLHFAATGKTAAQLIHERAHHELPNMGLRTWKGEAVLKADVTIAKNYLDEAEIDALNRIVVMWLDFAEDQAKRRKQVFLGDWEHKLDDFLAFNDRALLANAGTISKITADTHAEAEYEVFASRRREWLEAEGERLRIEALEAAAKELPETSVSGPESEVEKK